MLKIRDEPDNNFEVSISASAMKVTLYNKLSLNKPIYRDTAVRSIGIIIANSCTKGLEYDQSDYMYKIESSRQLFKQLEIQEVRFLEDYTKDQLIQEFLRLSVEGAMFSKNHSQDQAFAIVISWVGYTANLKRLDKVPSDPLKPMVYENIAYHIDEFGLTKDGEPFAVEKYCVMVAN